MGKRNCDPWWEPETEWHRAWKAHFPTEWQEVGQVAADGERHIADIKAAHGLVIEFQHSALASLERTKRTDFYGNIVWVVDGLRRKNDRPRFEKETWDWQRSQRALHQLIDPEWALPYEWLDCSVPVFFDFASRDAVAPDDPYYRPPSLWCLLPRFSDESGIRRRLMLELTVSDFISKAHTGHPVPDWADIMQNFADRAKAAIAEDEKRMAEMKQRQAHFRWARLPRARWRF
jgi:hypothetical protein